MSFRLAKCLFVFPFFIVTATTYAQNKEVKIPDEVKPFVTKGMIPIACEASDLNADGRRDYILIISPIVPEGSIFDKAGDGDRPTLVLIRGADNKLSVAARNEGVAFCKNCGGIFGDPFAGLAARGTRFTISNFGGDNDRWGYDFTFGYSRRDHTWQLVRVQEIAFRASDAERTYRKWVYTPPKSFGLINFADFNLETYRQKRKQ